MDRLDRECSVFCRYLIGQTPSPYVVAKYGDYHRRAAVEDTPARIDRVLLAVASLHPATVRPADAYARIFRPGSVLRKKLILLLAVLESCAPSDERIDSIPTPPGTWMWIRLGLAIAWAGTVTVVVTAIGLPWQLVFERHGGNRP